LCRDYELIDCAADPFVPPTRFCPFGCGPGGCLPGVGDQLIVHTESHPGSRIWPDGPIPVCFADDDDSAENARLQRLTRSEAEQSWARYLDVEFIGWGSCENLAKPRVVVEYLDDCDGRLASGVRIGNPGIGGESRVGICRSYRDAEGLFHVTNDALVRFIARHQFGHVIGLDERYDDTRSTMVRAIRSSSVHSGAWASDIADLLPRYSYKPDLSIVHASSRCLDTAAAGGLARCSGSTTQRLRAFGDRVEIEGTSQCLAAGDGGALELGGCAPPPHNALVFRRARFGSPGYCIAPRSLPVVPGTPVETGACGPLGDDSQTWVFEIVAVTTGRPHARIRFGAQDYCLTEPEPAMEAVPTLEPCGSSSTVFQLGPDGNVIASSAQGTFCLGWDGNGSTLHFNAFCPIPLMLSGTLETADGRALTADPDDPGAGLVLAEFEPGATPTLGQVFDVVF
jgi:hypothetical protein